MQSQNDRRNSDAGAPRLACAARQASGLGLRERSVRLVRRHCVQVVSGFCVALALVALAPLRAQAPVVDDFNPWADGAVAALAVQPDGNVLAGGNYWNIGWAPCAYLGRLADRGQLDGRFLAGANGPVIALAILPGGRFLAAGGFSELGGTPHNGLGRLNEDGTLDQDFGATANASVIAVAVQPDGKILVGGVFTVLCGEARSHLGRLNADGTLDTSFDSDTDGAVYTLAVQPDGKVLVGGWFNTLGGQPHGSLGRLNADGTLDAGFTAEAVGSVSALLVQPDGKILVGGQMPKLGGEERNNIGRLNPDGTLDHGFNPGSSGPIYAMALQSDGRILVGGWFGWFGGGPRQMIARLYPNGSLDSDFRLDVNGTVNSLAIQEDGNILLGGEFTSVGLQPRNRIARLKATSPATHSLEFDGTNFTWLRGGSGAEVWRASMERSDDGVAWTALAPVERIDGGWRAPGSALGPNTTLRVRGHVSGSAANWYVEDMIGRPYWVSQPVSRTNLFSETARFSAMAYGGGLVSFQWFRNGAALADGGNVAGATTPTLTLSNLTGADRGEFRVIVSNAEGSRTSQVAQLTVLDPYITAQPEGLEREQGQSATLSVVAKASSALQYQWWHEGVALPQATNATLELANLQAADEGGYFVVASSFLGNVTSTVAQVKVNLATPDRGFILGTDDGVSTLALQPDGKILAGGNFTALGGWPRSSLGRLNANGTVDVTFTAAAWMHAASLLVQPDGRIVVGGAFSYLSQDWRQSLGRLHPDGLLDTQFAASADQPVNTLSLQADGKILVGGSFSNLNGQARYHLGRLNADGSLDTPFTVGTDGDVYALAVQPDGKILLGGSFTTVGGEPRTNIARLNADGALDSSFYPAADGMVRAVAVQADGGILVGGAFTNLFGVPRARLGRLNADGTLDQNFDPGADGAVYALTLQTDGRILVGGDFANLAGQSHAHLGRLNADGSPDASFAVEADGVVQAITVQPDGALLLGGAFTRLGGQPRSRIARLPNTAPAASSIESDGTQVTWWRSGTGPEVWHTTLEISPDGLTWNPPVAGERVNGGWRFAVGAAADATLRVRGLVNSGSANWHVVEYHGMPRWISQPASQTNQFGGTNVFRVQAEGKEPFRYQWFKNGVPLSDGGSISGALTPTLTVVNVSGADAGDYVAVVSNDAGNRSSAPAHLTVQDPLILAQPQNLYRSLGETALLSVTTAGTAPFGFQWWHDARPLPGATESTLSLAHLQAGDEGSYFVVATNLYGSATSVVAELSLNFATGDGGFNPGTGGLFNAVAVQPDGKLVIGGSFGTLAGAGRNNFGRLNSDGSLDASFQCDANGEVRTIVLQGDGKILAGGGFKSLAGRTRSRLGRIYPDGTLDEQFNPGANDWVDVLLEQPDGKILVGGAFKTLAGQLRSGLGRLNAEGTLDGQFSPTLGGLGIVESLALQPDGKILVGGNFSRVAGEPRQNLARLNPDGTLDREFNPGADDWVRALVVQRDGMILAGGLFHKMAGQRRYGFARLRADGTLDQSFHSKNEHPANSVALQADGGILLGGFFSEWDFKPRSRVARLNMDGSLDNRFSPEFGSIMNNAYVLSLAAQPDGKILVGGWFTIMAGLPRYSMGRLDATEPATQSLSYAGSTITWLRGGSSPEVWRTTFEQSAEGSEWAPLGAGEPIPGGWQLTGVSLPAGARIRARGFVTGGYKSASSWFVESFWPAADLAVEALDAPRLVHANSLQTISWTVANRGGLAPTNGWVDRVYLSSDTAVGADRLLGEFPVSGGLATNQTLARTLEVFVPADLPPNRDYWWVVVTDADAQVGEENESNNARVSADAVRLLPPPARDLTAALAADGLHLTFHAEPGLRFQVQVTTDLRQWTEVGTAAVAGDGTGRFTDSAPLPEAQRFYRLRLEP